MHTFPLKIAPNQRNECRSFTGRLSTVQFCLNKKPQVGSALQNILRDFPLYVVPVASNRLDADHALVIMFQDFGSLQIVPFDGFGIGE